MLAAYLVGQLPAGALADRLGGARVLLSGLALWSAATAATALAAGGGGGALAVLYGSRVLLGLSSACAMPCVTAAVVEWVPQERRAGAIAAVYALFNMGGVIGLVLAPLLAQAWGLAAAFVLAGLAGVAWAAGGGAFLSAAGLLPARDSSGDAAAGSAKAAAGAAAAGGDAAGEGDALLSPSRGEAGGPSPRRLSDSEGAPAGLGGAGAGQAEPPPTPEPSVEPPAPAAAAAAAVQGKGAGPAGGGATFMGIRLARGGLWQNWIPVYLSSLGRQQLSATGGMAALPWLAAAAAGVASGGAADRLIRAGVPVLRVRRLFQCASFLGCAASALPLSLAGAPGLGLAVGCLTANLAFYSASFGGFHAYVQDVAGPSAGVLQGLTNSCSIAMGMAGNLATGWLVEATGSYSSVFWFLAALYTAAAGMWATCTTGEPLEAPRAAPA